MISLMEIDRALDKRGLYMYLTSQVELKNGGVKTIWVAYIRDLERDVIGPIRRKTIRDAKIAAFEELLRKEG